MKEKWQTLVTENPMLIEIARFRRKFLSFSGSSTLNGIVLGLAIVCYIGLLLLVFSARGSMPPIALVMFQTFVFTLATPSMLYGAIAGEREKRTWDLLMVAPISKEQIVAGKFIGSLVAVGVGLGLFSLPILVTAFEYDRTNWFDVLAAECCSVTFIVMLASITLFFSARSSRGFMALGTVLGTLAIFLIIVPLLSTAVLQNRLYVDLINFFHPYYVQSQIMLFDESNSLADGMKAGSWGWPQSLSYVLITFIFLVWAARTLGFAENDVKFIPANSHA